MFGWIEPRGPGERRSEAQLKKVEREGSRTVNSPSNTDSIPPTAKGAFPLYEFLELAQLIKLQRQKCDISSSYGVDLGSYNDYMHVWSYKEAPTQRL